MLSVKVFSEWYKHRFYNNLLKNKEKIVVTITRVPTKVDNKIYK